MSPGAGHSGPNDRGEIFWQGNIRAQNSKSDSSSRKEAMTSMSTFSKITHLPSRDT